MSAIEELVTVSRLYAEAEKIELSTVSSRVFDDGKKLAAIESGGDIQVRRAERAMQWFSDHWPEGADWPPHVRRPARSSQEDAA